MYVKLFKVMIMIKYKKFYLTSKLKKNKINNTLKEKYKDMNENPVFEQDYWSRTAIYFHKNGYDSIRLLNWICFYDRSHYENIYYFDLMASVLICLNEISER